MKKNCQENLAAGYDRHKYSPSKQVFDFTEKVNVDAERAVSPFKKVQFRENALLSC